MAVSAILGITSMIGKHCSKHIQINTCGTLVGDHRSHLNDRNTLLKAHQMGLGVLKVFKL